MARLRKLWNSHPNLVSWFVLALGMVIIVVLAARHVGFTAGQWAALIVATVSLAGLCVWIISWDDREPDAEEVTGVAAADPQGTPVAQQAAPEGGPGARK
jgi:hypothetical protein